MWPVIAVLQPRLSVSPLELQLWHHPPRLQVSNFFFFLRKQQQSPVQHDSEVPYWYLASAPIMFVYTLTRLPKNKNYLTDAFLFSLLQWCFHTCKDSMVMDIIHEIKIAIFSFWKLLRLVFFKFYLKFYVMMKLSHFGVTSFIFNFAAVVLWNT